MIGNINLGEKKEQCLNLDLDVDFEVQILNFLRRLNKVVNKVTNFSTFFKKL